MKELYHELKDTKYNSLKNLYDKIKLLSDGQYAIYIFPLEQKRSIKQNNYLHWIYQLIAEETGHTKDEIKEYFNDKFGSRTRDLTPKELGLRIEQIRAWAATELSIYVPEASRIPVKNKRKSDSENSEKLD